MIRFQQARRPVDSRTAAGTKSALQAEAATRSGEDRNLTIAPCCLLPAARIATNSCASIVPTGRHIRYSLRQFGQIKRAQPGTRAAALLDALERVLALGTAEVPFAHLKAGLQIKGGDIYRTGCGGERRSAHGSPLMPSNTRARATFPADAEIPRKS